MKLTHFPQYDEHGHVVEMADTGTEGSVYVDGLYAGYVVFEREIQEWRATTLKPDDKCLKTKEEAVDLAYSHFVALDVNQRIRNSIIDNFPTPVDLHWFLVDCIEEGLKKDEMYGDAITEDIDIDMLCHDLLKEWSNKYKNRRETTWLNRGEKRSDEFNIELISARTPVRYRKNGVRDSLSKRQAEELIWIEKVLSHRETPENRSIRLSTCHAASLRALHRKGLIIWRSETPLRDVITTIEGCGLVRLLGEWNEKEKKCESSSEKK